MIKIERTNVYGWESAIHGMRNPMNSWDKSDSFRCNCFSCKFEECPEFNGKGCDKKQDDFILGGYDSLLMKKLVKAGTDHSKFMRMIVVDCDITAPLYWWKEFDTYKVGTVRNSCSTMHKIHEKKFTKDDFSHEHLIPGVMSVLNINIETLNNCRENYIKTKSKDYWWQMIQLLPSSYNQMATVQLNYAVLRNMYHSRKAHKLDEWHTFCHWIESLPYSELITEVC